MDFSKYKFRPSAMGNIMTPSRSKSDLLSETAKTYISDAWIAEVYGRERLDIKNKFTDKGIQCESDSLDLLQKVTNDVYFKNQKKISNAYLAGTPDVIDEKIVIDIKTSFDIWTFHKVDEGYAKKQYYWQILSYMWLTNAPVGELIFCLVNTPEDIIQKEFERYSYVDPKIQESDEGTAKFMKNYIFDDIDPKQRIKRFKFDYSEEDVELMKVKIELSREYMKGLSL